MTGPPIIRRPCASVAPSAAARNVAEKQEEPPEISEASCSISLHEQALEVFEAKARVARAVVVFDPRHVFGPEMPVQHGVLLSGDECNPQARFSYPTGDPDACEVDHMSRKFYGSTVHGRDREGVPCWILPRQHPPLEPTQAEFSHGLKTFRKFADPLRVNGWACRKFLALT
ncbi:MAG TPA: hypothetical protein VM715_06760, partial [Candidatus Acidoferrum sp.]|nr:hypothetical protein [Candidatus Acidoferrum sp.]